MSDLGGPREPDYGQWRQDAEPGRFEQPVR